MLCCVVGFVVSFRAGYNKGVSEQSQASKYSAESNDQVNALATALATEQGKVAYYEELILQMKDSESSN